MSLQKAERDDGGDDLRLRIFEHPVDLASDKSLSRSELNSAL